MLRERRDVACQRGGVAGHVGHGPWLPRDDLLHRGALGPHPRRVEDDDVDGEMLETYGGLLAFAEAKAIES